MGGKAYSQRGSTGTWVASMLPSDTSVCYVEPFAGMLGVLLQRPRCANELVNDLDRNIYTWWKAIRERPDELLHRIRHTPMSRVVFNEARALLASAGGGDIERAWAAHTVLRQSLLHGLSAQSWGRTFDTTKKYNADMEHLERIVERVQHVQLECMDALELVRGCVDKPRVLLYADPPYRDADHVYGVDTLDRGAFASVLREFKGCAAISGYGDEWDDLGWERHVFATAYSRTDESGIVEQSARTEVLWTNYTVQARMF